MRTRLYGWSLPYPWQWPGVFAQSTDPGTGNIPPAETPSGNNPPETPPGTPPAAGGGNGDPSNVGGGTPPNPPKPAPAVFTPEQQDYINRLIGRTREEERRKIRDEAETEAAKAKGEFEKLWKESDTKVKELEPLAQEAKDLSTIIHASIDARVEKWPKEVKDTDPGKDTTAKARLIWADRSEPLAKRLEEASAAPNLEHGRGGGGGPVDTSKQYIDRTYPIPGRTPADKAKT